MSVKMEDLDFVKTLSLCLTQWVEKNKMSVSFDISCLYNEKNKDNGIEISIGFGTDNKTDEEKEVIINDCLKVCKNNEILLQLSVINNFLETLKKEHENTKEINNFLDKTMEKVQNQIKNQVNIVKNN